MAHWTRRQFSAAAISMLTAGCYQNPVIENAGTAIKFVVAGADDPPLKRKNVAALPYATITAKIGRAPRTLLVLAYVDGADLHWHSGDKAALVTRHGRVVKTVGLPENLRQTINLTVDPLAGPIHELKQAAAFRRQLEYDGDERPVLPIRSVFESLGAQQITILELDFETVLVRERNTAQLTDWQYENLYWVDAYDGFVWKSRQHLTRDLPPIEIEVLKPATL